MQILISGANGFVGVPLSKTLISNRHHITQITRNSTFEDFSKNSVNCVIHLAGRAHVIKESTSGAFLAYKKANIDYTLKIASMAKSLDAKRFIFISSIKVNGESSKAPLTELDIPAPIDAYGQTKLKAEILLKDFCALNEIELVIIRPPLIYGPSVKANFKSLIQLCRKPIPLPFGRVLNKRSLISLENLNSFIELCCHHPQAANQTFLISDDHDVSTTELINTIRVALGRKACQLPVPEKLLSVAFDMAGKHALNERLLGNLQVDITKAKELLGWRPVISFEEGIKRTVAEYVI